MVGGIKGKIDSCIRVACNGVENVYIVLAGSESAKQACLGDNPQIGTRVHVQTKREGS